MIEASSETSTVPTDARGYILTHWRGALPLALSFWVNLVLLRAAIFFLGGLTHPPFIADPYAAAILSILFIAAAHVGVYAWQIVGVVRACDRYQAAESAVVPVYGVYFGIAVSLVFTLSSAFTAVQNTFVEPEDTLLSLIWERERASRYALHLSDDGNTVYLDGSFERGMTEKLNKFLQRNRAVTGIVLTSPGGNIFEGRGVGKLILDRGLDTHVTGTCASACARAFIAGKTRSVGPDARLGFHRYRLDAHYPVPFVDIAEEQERDRAFYRSRNVKGGFLDRMFERVQPDLWVPPLETLLDAGVVHRIEANR